MFLYDIQEKPIYAKKNLRGVCRGIGISTKTQAVKYLLCSSCSGVSTPIATDFSIHTSVVENVDDRITVSALRPVFPKSCIKLSIGLPVYSYEGIFLGTLQNADIENFTASTFTTDQGATYPISAIFACSDAVILRKEQAYPIGQRIPAPSFFDFSVKSTVVTKPVLREAIKKGKLLRLTLSLPPFSVEPWEISEKRRKFF